MKRILAAMAISAIIIVVAFIAFWNKGNAVKYRTEKVARGDMEAVITATGTVNAVTTVLVGTQVSGTIKDIYADFNSPVKKGRVIARIDPAAFEAQVAEARANLLAAEANLEKAEAALADSKRTMGRNKDLFSRGFISRSELDTSETNHETAKAEINAAKARIAQSSAALKYAETNLRYTSIVSPVDGVVVSRNVDVGQTVAASFQTPTLFTIAQDLTKMQIDSSVVEADIGRVGVGQPVGFTVDAYPDIAFKGVVSEVRNAPTVVQNVVTYDAVVKVDNAELRLKPGMTANVSIITSTRKGVLRIPNAALRFTPAGPQVGAVEEKGGGPSGTAGVVWIIKDGKPGLVKVITGINDGNFTELVEGDIREGQELIVESLTKAKPRNASSGPRMF